MECTTTGTVISVARQWWLKVNTKPVRLHAMDGATFPHIIKVQYTVAGRVYFKRKWISAGKPVPYPGEPVTVLFNGKNPKKAQILWNTGKTVASF
jgi:hypothetical protein